MSSTCTTDDLAARNPPATRPYQQQQHRRHPSSLLSDTTAVFLDPTSPTTTNTAHLPHPPRPCAQPPFVPSSRRSTANDDAPPPPSNPHARHDSSTAYLHTTPHPHQHYTHHHHPQYKSGSLSSSAGSSSVMTYTDLEKPTPASPHHHSPSHSTHFHDPEKAMPPSSPRNRSPSPSTTSHAADHALSTLLFLSGPHLLLSLLLTFWSLLALLLTTLSQPIRLCATRPTFPTHLSSLLGPTLNLQLRCIRVPLPPHADEDRVYNAAWLFGVHLLSPVVAFGVMGAAWVVGVYWVASRMVGDPAGTDRRDDGRETVMGLRGWWAGWLEGCIKEDVMG